MVPREPPNSVAQEVSNSTQYPVRLDRRIYRIILDICIAIEALRVGERPRGLINHQVCLRDFMLTDDYPIARRTQTRHSSQKFRCSPRPTGATGGTCAVWVKL